jgi:hypothetical protein
MTNKKLNQTNKLTPQEYIEAFLDFMSRAGHFMHNDLVNLCSEMSRTNNLRLSRDTISNMVSNWQYKKYQQEK